VTVAGEKSPYHSLTRVRHCDRRNGASNLLCREPMFIKMFIKTRPPALKAVLQLFRSP
jgi:hypothetical protein